MKIKPLSIKEEKTSKSGIVIPDTAEEKPMMGKVIAIGPGKITDDGKILAMNVKVGDKVLFTKYAPTEIKIDNKEYYVIREDEVMAIVEN